MTNQAVQATAHPRHAQAQTNSKSQPQTVMGANVLVVPSSTALPTPTPKALIRSSRSSAVVWELGQSRQPLLQAHRQYLRLRFGPLEFASRSARQNGRKAAPRPDVYLCFSRGKSTLRNGAAARGACSYRPLSGRPAWPSAT